MMYFGWRPIESCYGNTSTQASVNAAMSQRFGVGCPQPVWFYLLLGAAVIGGLSHKKK